MGKCLVVSLDSCNLFLVQLRFFWAILKMVGKIANQRSFFFLIVFFFANIVDAPFCDAENG